MKSRAEKLNPANRLVISICIMVHLAHNVDQKLCATMLPMQSSPSHLTQRMMAIYFKS